MNRFLIGVLTTFSLFYNFSVSYADNEYRGIIPGVLTWGVESISEQWTQSADLDSESFEQVHWAINRSEKGEYDFVPIAKRFNRQLVITLHFLNLGSQTCHFDNESRLEASIQNGSKTIRVDATPTSVKTFITPNGRIKYCSFIIKMNNRAFVDAFDNRTAIADLSINPLSGKLLIEDAQGASVLDNVGAPGKFDILSHAGPSPFYFFPEIGKTYTVQDVVKSINQIYAITAPKSPQTDAITIKDGAIEKLFDIPNTIDKEAQDILLFSYNGSPIAKDNTAELLKKPFGSNDVLQIGVFPLYLLKIYLPSLPFNTLLINEFKDNIAQLPEDIAPKRFQEVNYMNDLEKSYLKLKEFAESGDNEAIEVIGRTYNPEEKPFKGGFLFEDYEDALQWLKGLSDKGYVQAQLSAGLYYENGLGIKENLSKAVKYYKMAADQGNAEAMVCYANALYRENQDNLDESLKWYRKSAELGNSRAQYILAKELLRKEHDNPEILKESIEWLQKSADLNYPEALYALGIQYLFGDGVPQDDKKAFSLIEQAAESGYPLANNALGRFYLNGIGVERNGNAAVLFYGLGALDGVPESMFWYGRFLCDGYNIPKDFTKGFRLIKDAALKGYDKAELFMGKAYMDGKNVKQNPQKAFSWIEKAANHDNPTAMAYLGDFYKTGFGVKADPEKAFELYKKSADEEDPYGIFRWGQHLYEDSDSNNSQMGYNYIDAAARMGDPEAQKYLNQLDEINVSDDDDEDANATEDDKDSQSKEDHSDTPLDYDIDENDDVNLDDEEDPFE